MKHFASEVLYASDINREINEKVNVFTTQKLCQVAF